MPFDRADFIAGLFVLAYYKLAALEEMSEGSYRRALDLLQRRRSKQIRDEAAHAQN